jgi:hypothetical protein
MEKVVKAQLRHSVTLQKSHCVHSAEKAAP